MSPRKNLPLQILPWLLSALVVILALLAWVQTFAWHLPPLSPYVIFPAIGLIAFSLMWAQYITGALQLGPLHEATVDNYYRWSGHAVLLAIVLHPGLLIYQRFRDGFGLPPGSYESFVAPGLAWVTLLGSVCLLIFLALELHRWFGQRAWWRYVRYLGDAAMVAIFYHGLVLGDQTHLPWFRVVWWCYGLSLLAALVLRYSTAKNTAVMRVAGAPKKG